MNKKRAIIVAVAAVLVLPAAVYLWGPPSVPAGQEPLITLSDGNISKFESAFDGDVNATRLLLLVSPT